MHDCYGRFCFEHSGWKGRSSVLETLSNWKDDPNESSGVQLVGQKAVEGEEGDVEKQADDETTDVDDKDSEEDEDSEEDKTSPDTELTLEANVEPVPSSEAEEASNQPEEKKTTESDKDPEEKKTTESDKEPEEKKTTESEKESPMSKETNDQKIRNPTTGEQDTSSVSS